jgi:hypothetical protein
VHGNIGEALVRTFLGFCFYFDLDFLNGVQNSIGLHAQVYLITNCFGGRQAVGGSYADFV